MRILVLAWALALGAGAGNALAAEKVVLQLKWVPQFQFAGLYAAREMGYYAEAGFDVEIRPREPHIRVIESVLNGEAQFGVSDSSLILHRLRGKPVVALAAIFQHSPLVLLTLKSKGLLGPYELKGKRIMFQKGFDDATFTAMFHQLGISEDQYTHVPHNFDDDALLTGNVDAMSAYVTDQPFHYAQKGVEVQVIAPLNYGIDLYGDMLFASEAYVREDPARAARFIEASLRGWAYALANKEEAIGWLRRKYGSSKSLAHLRYEAEQTEKMILPSLVQIGHMNVSRFQRIADIYKKENLAPDNATLEGIDFADYVNPRRATPLWLKVAGGATAVLLLAALILLAINRRLARLVALRTRALEQQTAELEALSKQQATLNQQLSYEIGVKDRFFSIIAHDLRSPFTALLGLTQIMAEKADLMTREKLVECAGRANASGHKVFELLENLLAWSKFQMEKENIAPVDFGLRDVVIECGDLLDRAYDEKDVTLDYDVDAAQQVHADRDMVQTVLRNLLANAVKFTPSGGAVQVVAVPEGDSIRITVRDNGVGMAADFAANVFVIDRKTSKSGTDGEIGTGLGLPLCKEMVEQNGGRIWVDSAEGVGSAFHFTLPAGRLRAPLEEHLREAV